MTSPAVSVGLFWVWVLAPITCSVTGRLGTAFPPPSSAEAVSETLWPCVALGMLNGVRFRLAAGGSGRLIGAPPPPMRCQAVLSLRRQARSNPPVFSTWLESRKVVVVPAIVTLTFGMTPLSTLHGLADLSEVSKFSPAVPVRIRICPGGRVTFLGQRS